MKDCLTHVLRMLSMGAHEQGHTCSVSLEDHDVSHCSFLSSLLDLVCQTQRVLNANSLIMTGDNTQAFSLQYFVTFYISPHDLLTFASRC